MKTKIFKIIASVIFVLFCLVAGYALWYLNRPLPEPVQNKQLFEGITYSRIIQREPYALIYHVVSIDLTTPGLRFLVTPEDEIDDFVYTARTTSQFLQEFDLQLAINGDFFDPWRDYGVFNYYPHVGDGVNIRGLSITQGQLITTGYAPPQDYATVYITADNQVTFTEPAAAIETAISGNVMLLIDGEYPLMDEQSAYLSNRHPRTVIALDKSEETMLLFVVDGRQLRYSEGASMPELADIARRHGAYTALNLDGGGSSALIMQDENGHPLQLGSAIHNRIPGRERPIANHFGIIVE